MFTQLAGLLKDRAVTITATDAGDGKLRVCIVPVKKSDDESAALTAPMVVVGTPGEIDAGLAGAITNYTESFVPLNEQTERIRAEREQAAKDEKAKAEEERKTRASKGAKKPTPAATPAKKIEKVEPKAPAAPVAETADLFATANVPAAASPTTASADPTGGEEAEEDDGELVGSASDDSGSET